MALEGLLSPAIIAGLMGASGLPQQGLLAPPQKAGFFQRMGDRAVGSEITGDDRRGLLGQALLGLASGMMQTGGQGTAGALGNGLAMGLQTLNQGRNDTLDRRLKRERFAREGGAPAQQRYLEWLAQQVPEAERQDVYRVAAGTAGRASNAGFQTVKFTDPDGRERIGVVNGRTGRIDLPDGTSFDPSSGVISNAPNATTAGGESVFIDPSLPPEVRNAIMANPDALSIDLAPAIPRPSTTAGVNPFSGRRPEDTAAAIEQAKTNVQLANLPTELGMRNQAAGEQARLVEQAKSAVDRDTKTATRARDANDALGLIAEARRLLPDATGGTLAAAGDRTAAFFGKGTAGAQANAALKTISGQLTAKQPRMEGPQSDRDVQMYKDMAGDVANENLPVSIRMAALDQIERLQQKYASGAQRPPGPAAGTVEDGYRFRGGNPADPNNWERL